ncbi:Protein phosphatase methylesterase 1 [Pleurostoma richardsiae]|uniref:Protein phosphatase methylesterase 1 n=1 Tax=Pleurostoma richardsiae TaxID=41990 RepID=A0AA38RCJ5_9PEZI|nr:Protein phosphatase methylesterase 1 [Pleurostoma richardsiae]
MSVRQSLRRAMLYIPGSSEKMLEKSRNLAIDCAIYDLEDSVSPQSKEAARKRLGDFLSSSRPHRVTEVAVRINGVDSGHALDDLTKVLRSPNVDTIVVPKVQTAADLHFVADVVRHLQPDQRVATSIEYGNSRQQQASRLLALIETAKGLVNLPDICKASPLLCGLGFAAEDFCLDLSITRSPSLSELLYARSAIVTAARAHDLPSAIDLVCTAFKGDEGLQALEDECADGRRLGFTGKQAIHPSQISLIQSAFGPSGDEVEWAVRVVTADAKASAAGKGAWTMDGKMVDSPVVSRAQGIVNKAAECGIDLQAMREKWKDQKPE